MAYDQKCYDLAVAFLEDRSDPVDEMDAAALAQHIQDAIEEWLDDN